VARVLSAAAVMPKSLASSLCLLNLKEVTPTIFSAAVLRKLSVFRKNY